MPSASTRPIQGRGEMQAFTLASEAIMSYPLIKSWRPVHEPSLVGHLFAATTILVAGLCTAAAAADMPVKAPQPATYQWSGCYVGINGGVGAGGSNFAASVGAGSYLVGTDPATVAADGIGSADNTTFAVGGQVGCNYQTGTIVVGLEGDYDYLPSKSQFNNDTNALADGTPFAIGQSLTSNYLATVRPRVGIAADRNFAYVTGGVAFSDATYSETYSDAAGGVGSASASKFLTGWTAGAGWEHAFSEHATLRFEYLYASFPATSAAGMISGPGGSNPLSGSGDLVIQVARAGLNFKF
jgi:outer membrane immunogenic protein